MSLFIASSSQQCIGHWGHSKIFAELMLCCFLFFVFLHLNLFYEKEESRWKVRKKTWCLTRLRMPDFIKVKKMIIANIYIVLNTFQVTFICVSVNLLSTMTFWCRHYYLHFIDEETDSGLNGVPEATELNCTKVLQFKSTALSGKTQPSQPWKKLSCLCVLCFIFNFLFIYDDSLASF